MIDAIVIYTVLGLTLLFALVVMAFICVNGIYALFGDFIERAKKVKEARNWDRKED